MADSAPRVKFVAQRTQSISVRQLRRPLMEYMHLPASQYSVLDAERIERVDDDTFSSRAHQLLLNRMTNLMEFFDTNWYGHAASMENKISCDSTRSDIMVHMLTSNAVIEFKIEVAFAFRAIPTQAIESTGSQVLEQILKAMPSPFMSQVSHSRRFLHIRNGDKRVELEKDYNAWGSGYTSRQPLGTVFW